LSEVVEEMAHLLEVSISKKSVLRYNLAKDLPAIEADVTQIRQVIMNLIINASEAIGEKSGVIRVTTGAMSCDRNYLSDTYLNEDLSEGQYVYVEVADTGCGMSPETKAKLFDPFFTTKFTGRGLGLAALLGIIRGHRGAVKVYSELGRGSTFKVLLPAAPGATRPVAIPPTLAETLRGSGGVLVVDDEEIVRGLAREVLGDAGFTVYTASDGEQALDLFRQHAHEIQVVLLDLTMPHMDGLETFTDMRRIRNDVRVILSSGYNEQDATEQFAGKGLTGFIHKPYVAQDLIQIVCKVMAIEVKGKDRSATTRRSPRRRKKG
jgi:two-component system cell cycle sensor histidine kinase/response regulator CckA